MAAEVPWWRASGGNCAGGTSAATPADVARVLLEWFESWNRTGRVEYAPHTDRIAELTTERQTELLAAVLSTAVGANRL